MDYLFINPPTGRKKDERRRHFMLVGIPYFRAYRQFGDDKMSRKMKSFFRQSLLEYYKDITGIAGFIIHFSGKGKREVTLIEAAQSEQFTLLFRQQRRIVAGPLHQVPNHELSPDFLKRFNLNTNNHSHLKVSPLEELPHTPLEVSPLEKTIQLPVSVLPVEISHLEKSPIKESPPSLDNTFLTSLSSDNSEISSLSMTNPTTLILESQKFQDTDSSTPSITVALNLNTNHDNSRIKKSGKQRRRIQQRSAKRRSKRLRKLISMECSTSSTCDNIEKKDNETIPCSTRQAIRKLKEVCFQSRMNQKVIPRQRFTIQSRKLEPTSELKQFVNLCRRFLIFLIKQPIGSENGCPIVLEMPNGNSPRLNFLRHAPIRLLYGLNKSIQGDSAIRYAYSSVSGSGTVGADPRTFEVRLMPEDLQIASHRIKEILRIQEHPDMCLLDFNSVEIKLYMGKRIKAAGGAEMKTLQNDKLNFHCDQTYSKNGKFMLHMNSQEPWTPVVIASFGAPRKLAFQLVDVNSKDVILEFEIEMKDGDVFLLCPADEYPTRYMVQPIQTAKWKHGVTKLQNDDDFSVAIMFRAVKNTVKVDQTTNKKILSRKDKKSLEKVINTAQCTGRKKRMTHFDLHEYKLMDFKNKQAKQVHKKMLECANEIFTNSK